LTSPATPTTSRQTVGDSGHPRFTRLPIASPPGHMRRASDSFTIATGADRSVSASLNARPRTIRVPIAAKYPAPGIVIAANGRLRRSGTDTSAAMNGVFQSDPSVGSRDTSPAARTPGSWLMPARTRAKNSRRRASGQPGPASDARRVST